MCLLLLLFFFFPGTDRAENVAVLAGPRPWCPVTRVLLRCGCSRVGLRRLKRRQALHGASVGDLPAFGITTIGFSRRLGGGVCLMFSVVC